MNSSLFELYDSLLETLKSDLDNLEFHPTKNTFSTKEMQKLRQQRDSFIV